MMARGLGKDDAKPSKALVRNAKTFIEAKEELDDAKQEKAAAEEKVKKVQKKFVEAMKSAGVSSFKADKLGGFRTQVVMYPNKKDEVALTKYIKRRKSLAFLYTTSINGQKFKAWVKELREQGKPLPPGIDPYEETQIRRY